MAGGGRLGHRLQVGRQSGLSPFFMASEVANLLPVLNLCMLAGSVLHFSLSRSRPQRLSAVRLSARLSHPG
jgi:hypothetical protein